MSRLFAHAALLVTLLSAQAQAQPTWFEVEVFVFERDSQTNEQWSEAQRHYQADKLMDLISPALLSDVSDLSQALQSCSAAEWATDPEGCNQRWQQPTQAPSLPSTIPWQIGAREPLELEETSQAEQPSSVEIDAETQTIGTEAVELAEAQEQTENMPTDPNQAPLLLRDDELQFGEMIANLQRQLRLKPMLHMGWRQGVQPRFKAKAFHLFGGEDLSEQFDRQGLPVQTSELDSLIPQFSFLQSQTTETQPLWQLEGSLKIYLDHYLFVETDFVLREPGLRKIKAEKTLEDSEQVTASNVEVSEVQEEQSFLYHIPFVQNKRVKSREMHYFDHPKMGVILQIRRMQQPGEESPEG
ncbi:CsiV family protein [Paraferrimonas sedimenticola]|uniref:Peptidoglycan-binding protein, CsiV n=1 Tax=Paraferrimonas sedimenticola TaxID=375674 RepID=A0AA37W035_9GAMM|nr:CsiV family protein [Paraferrimonas sedimenticola]GLP94888.1 hypothetical protein GCM10007895_01940 [Paraferrimonas sedimenticola]